MFSKYHQNKNGLNSLDIYNSSMNVLYGEY